MTDPGYYDQSIPPALLIGGARRTAARASATAEGTIVPAGHQPVSSPRLVAAPGMPGTYDPPTVGSARPRNVTELTERCDPASPDPWPAGTYVPVGTSGKHAHWTGAAWKGGESPGYAEPVPVMTEPVRTPLPPPPYTAFPGDERPGDLTR